MSSTRTINVPLLRKAVEWVEEQAALPAIDCHWHQAAYVQSPHARAFGLLKSVGFPAETRTVENLTKVAKHCGTAYCVAGYIGQLLDDRYVTCEQVDGVHVGDFAARQLGLDQFRADELFDGSNTAADVRRIAEKFAGEVL